MNFIGTRGGKVAFSRAVAESVAAGGGLYVPESFPAVSAKELEELLEKGYPGRVAFILSRFCDFAVTEDVCAEAFSGFEEDPAPLVKLDDGVFMLELFNGPTCSCGDFSLALFPYILGQSLKKCGKDLKPLIISATAGDGGEAAARVFGGYGGAEVFVCFPCEGVSKMQKLALCATDAQNAAVCGVRAHLEECVFRERELLSNENFRAELEQKGYIPVSADSLNIGTVITRIAFFFSAYLDLVSGGQTEMGEKIDITLPAGNLGNALAAYYAKLMGLPVRRIHCACSRNSAFPGLLATGECGVRREFYKSTAPYLDVIYPLNLERLLFEVSGRNRKLAAVREESLESSGVFRISAEESGALCETFDAGFAEEDSGVEAMYGVFTDVGYVMDTGTGYAMKVALDWFEKNKKDQTPMVIVSPSHPYKYPQDVLYAVTGNDVKDCFKGVKRLHAATAMAVPKFISGLRNREPAAVKTVELKKLAEEIVALAK